MFESGKMSAHFEDVFCDSKKVGLIEHILNASYRSFLKEIVDYFLIHEM